MDSTADVWRRVLEILRGELTSTAISTWFNEKECYAVKFFDSTLVIRAPTPFKRDILEGRFHDPIKRALEELFSSGDFRIEVLCDEALDIYMQELQLRQADDEEEEYTFERFVVGNSNKFAHAAALAVADEQTKDFNPLFIYGESGLGKTHLLHAIRHVISKKHPDYHSILVKGEDFTNELISAVQTGRNIQFREKYRGADLLLIDDIQFIAGKVQTQEEFFHTFNTLYESGRQIVFTSDRPPNEMARLEDRLKTRFESGILADIQPPDYETRMAIIKNKLAQGGKLLPEDVMTYIAENMTSNVRQIEGAVKKVIAYKELLKDELTVTLAANALKDMFKGEAQSIPTAELIIDETAKFYSLAPEDMRGQRRTRNTALARQVSMFLVRKLTNLSLKDIGDLYEGRDHTTVLSSIRRVEDMIRDTSDFSQTLRDITANINAKI